MPSARQDLFIMGFIHIYKFASNKCTVLKLAHFISARKKLQLTVGVLVRVLSSEETCRMNLSISKYVCVCVCGLLFIRIMYRLWSS